MSIYVAVLILGQVGNAGDPPVSSFNSPPETAPTTSAAPAPVTFGIPIDGQPTTGLQDDGRSTPVRQEPAALRGRRSTVGSLPAAPPASLRAPLAAPVATSPATITEPEPRSVPAAAKVSVGDSAGGFSGVRNSQALQVAATMMEEILVLDESSQQTTRRVRLVEALSRLADPGLQSVAIRSYWELAQAIANARYAGDKVRVLSELTSPASEVDGAVLEEARASAAAEEAAAQDTLLAAQYGLLRVTGLPIEEALPWPADAPLVASYRTQFETIFANRVAPLPVRQIHHSLPGKLWVIEKRVSAVAAAESSLDAIAESYNGSRAPLAQALLAIERLDRSRRAFLASIVDYNQQIAEYSLAVVGSGVGPETLVTTLIRSVPANSALATMPRDVRQAAAAAPAQ